MELANPSKTNILERCFVRFYPVIYIQLQYNNLAMIFTYPSCKNSVTVGQITSWISLLLSPNTHRPQAVN